MSEPTDPTTDEVARPVGFEADEAADRTTPKDKLVEREIWRELAAQRGKIDTTATLTGETHNRLIGVERDMADVKVTTSKQADLTAQLVEFAGAANAREDRRETREIDRETIAAAKAAAKVKADADAELALGEAEAAEAERRGRTLDKLVDWWTGNWKLIAIAIAVLAGLNVQPLLQAFGLMAPQQVVVAPVEVAPAPVAEVTPAPAEPAPESAP